MLTGFAFEHFARRAIVQCLVRTLVVVEFKPFADAPARLDHRAIIRPRARTSSIAAAANASWVRWRCFMSSAPAPR
jgi:hypothetical protein